MARTPFLRRLNELLSAPSVEQLEERRFTRRQFLQASGAAAGGLLLGGLRPLAALAAASTTEPVVILGAGVAGLTCAYRLRKAGVASVLYESSARFGGRMFTKNGFNEQGMFCELGGELIDTYHAEMLALAQELGLASEDLHPEDSGVPRNLYYFGGKAHDEADLMSSAQPFIDAILASRAEIFGGKEEEEVYYKEPYAAARLDQLTLKEYLATLTNVEPWVRSAFEMAYVTEFGVDSDKQSALNMILLVGVDPKAKAYRVFGSSDEAKRLVGGSGGLPKALAARLGITGSESASFKPGHQLVAIRANAAGGLSLTFAAPSGLKVVNARQVVCTIPFTRLRQVDGIYNLGLSPVKAQSIRELGYGTNSKLMLGFDGRPWRDQAAGRPASAGGLFTDLQSQSFWETSRLQKGSKGILTNYMGGSKGLAASMADVPLALADLDTLHPGLAKLHDKHTALFNWGRYEHNLGSYVAALPGQYTTHFGAAAEPELGGSLLFAGEHTSLQFSGYMNGGVSSGNLASAAVLKSLKRPAPKKSAAVAVP